MPRVYRLAELADAFEFEDCVEECLKSLGRNLTVEAAMIALDDSCEITTLFVISKSSWKQLSSSRSTS